MFKRHNNFCKIAIFTIAAAITLPGLSGVVAMADTPAAPYNINFTLGSDATQLNFNWLTATDNGPELQIAKTSALQNGNFPTGSTIYGAIYKVKATTAVLDQPDVNPNAATGEYENKATATGLAPSTQYSYRVGDGTTWSSTYTVTTGNPGSGFSFAAFGDPQIGASGAQATDQAGWANTLSTVTTKYPALNFLFTLGDQVNNYDGLGTQTSEYQSFFNPDSSKTYLQNYPLVTLEGNHDYQMGTYYSFHYNQPNRSYLGQTTNSNVKNNDGDYWFTYGSTLFLVLNANDAYDIAAHDKFISKAIAANPNAKWKVAAWHQSAYSEANHSSNNAADDPILFIRQNWTKLMDKYGIDVVFQGHDHYYTRTFQMYGGVPDNTTKTNAVTSPKGTVYFTLDSGSGSKYYKFASASDHTFSACAWQNNVPTYSYITMNNTQFTINTFRTDTGASIDSYSITKTASSSAAKIAPASASIKKLTGTTAAKTAAVTATALGTAAANGVANRIQVSPTNAAGSMNLIAVIALISIVTLLAFGTFAIVSLKKKAGVNKE